MADRRSPHLHTVKNDGESKSVVSRKKSASKTVAAAAASGDHRDLLVAMRERIAVTVSDVNCPPRDLAALTRRLQEIAKEIEALDAAAEQEERESAAVEDEEFTSEAL